MARPQNKEELLQAAAVNYGKLMDMIAAMSREELDVPFDFSADEKKKEAHWARDKNLRDVLMHLYEWHRLTLTWIPANKAGNRIQYLMDGYNWKTYGDMNMVFWRNAQDVPLEQAMEKFKESHRKIVAMIESMSDEELFTKAYYDWTGTTSIGAYFISNTSAHYDWAMKKLKAHKKNVQSCK